MSNTLESKFIWCKCGHRKMWHYLEGDNHLECEVYGCECKQFISENESKPKEENHHDQSK